MLMLPSKNYPVKETDCDINHINHTVVIRAFCVIGIILKNALFLEQSCHLKLKSVVSACIENLNNPASSI